MAKSPTYCWDASVILAWLGEEPGAPLGDIDLVIGEIDRREANLLVPATAFSEVLEAKHTPEQMSKFKDFLARSNEVVADITQTIAEKAGEIRGKALAMNPPRQIKTPDAQFIAAAIVFGADVFHTLERNQLPGLSRSEIVNGLRISAPKPLKGPPAMFNDPTASPEQLPPA